MRSSQLLVTLCAVLGVCGCTASAGDAPSGIAFSSEVESLSSVSSPLPEDEIFPVGSRAVAYAENADGVVVISVGSNTCGVTVARPESGTEGMSVDLASEPSSQIKRSDELGTFADAGIDISGHEWVLRCGSLGVQICGIPAKESLITVGLVKANDGECLAVDHSHQ